MLMGFLSRKELEPKCFTCPVLRIGSVEYHSVRQIDFYSRGIRWNLTTNDNEDKYTKRFAYA